MSLHKFFFFFCISLFISAGISSCGKRPPLLPLAPQHAPALLDSGNHDQLIHAVTRHLEFLQSLSPGDDITIGGIRYPLSWMIESLELFLELAVSTESSFELSQMVQKQFSFFQASGRDGFSDQQMLITGYYEPLLEGSLIPVGPYKWPLYATPDNLATQSSKGQTKVYRITATGGQVAYWTREEIEENGYLKGSELVYLKDPFDAFTIHVQGSGKILLRDGTIRSIHYAGSNGRPYNSIGKLMVDRNIMTREEVSMERLRNYIHQHPEQRKDILYHNQKYIFFQWASDNHPPKGSTGVELTPTRSIAIDPQTLPRTALAFLITRQPRFSEDGQLTGWQNFNQFVLPQDSGSAIKGAGRVDLFLGNSEQARKTAGIMQENGKLFFLVKKGYKAEKQ